MGTDTHPAESQAGQAFEVIHHDESDRFYELLADGQPRGLAVYEADRQPLHLHAYLHHRGSSRPGAVPGPLLRGVLEDLKARHITVTNYCPVLDHFIEKNPGYISLIDPGKPGTWPKSHRDTAADPPATTLT